MSVELAVTVGGYTPATHCTQIIDVLDHSQVALAIGIRPLSQHASKLVAVAIVVFF